MATQSTTKQSLSQRWGDYQPSKTLLIWTGIMAIIATIVVGFSWGGWVTGGTSRTTAITAGDVARGDLATAICVEKFNAAPDAAARLVELKAISSASARRQFVEAGGWATMPGQTAPDRLGLPGCITALSAT